MSAADTSLLIRPLTEDLLSALESDLPRMIGTRAVPGVSMALIQDGEIVFHHACGVIDAVSAHPISPDTIFEVASLSKPVFAYAVLKLCEQQVLNLDAPLVDYLPAVYTHDNPNIRLVTSGQNRTDHAADLADDPRLCLITGRRVLSHTSGLPNWRPARWSTDELPLALELTPGERFSYSGEGYEYLQAVVEHLTQERLADHMWRQVLKPLGMNNSSFVWREQLESRYALGHDGSGRCTPKHRWPEANAACTLHTTAEDFAKFIIEIMARPASASYQQPHNLNENSLEEMVSVQAVVTDAISWGLGWGLCHSFEAPSIWHWGDNGVFQCFVAASKFARCGAVVLTNSGNGLGLCRDVFNRVLRCDHPAFSWQVLYD